MKYIYLVFLVIIIISTGCSDEEEQIQSQPNKAYIKELLTPDTTSYYTGVYYVHVKFDKENESGTKELWLTTQKPNWSHLQDAGSGLYSQSIEFRDPDSNDKLDISLHFVFGLDTTFVITYADYFYSDPWAHIPGLNIEYYTPVHNTQDNYQFYRYLGQNSDISYFKITYIGNNRINGTFSTRMVECCGGINKYYVSGDFSVPNTKITF